MKFTRKMFSHPLHHELLAVCTSNASENVFVIRSVHFIFEQFGRDRGESQIRFYFPPFHFPDRLLRYYFSSVFMGPIKSVLFSRV